MLYVFYQLKNAGGLRMYAWLSREIHTSLEYLALSIKLVGVGIGWTVYVYAVLRLIGLIGPASFATPSLKELLVSLVLAPVAEEFLFRALPLYAAVRTGNTKFLAATVATTSIVFGIAHGFLHGLVISMIGLLFALMFLKAGGLRGAFEKPLWAAVGVHFVWNAQTYVILHPLLSFFPL